MKRKYFVWTPEATKHFLEAWETNRNNFRAKRKNLIHKDMAAALSDFGVPERAIRAKLQVMSRRYRNEALQFLKTGVYPKWKYFPKMRNIFGHSEDDTEEVCEETESADKVIEISDYESSSSEFEFPEPHSKLFKHDLDGNEEDDDDHNHDLFRRNIDVEEKKLAIQKEILHVMQTMANDLSSTYATFLDAYKISPTKRS